jgi:hypothetical protein
VIDRVEIARKPFFEAFVHRGTVEHDQERKRLGRGVVQDGVKEILVDGHLGGNHLSFARIVDLEKDEFGRVDAHGSG